MKCFAGSKATEFWTTSCAWYLKAAEYIQGTRIAVGYVSTNSITQGEQVSVLWRVLFSTFGIKIHFAHTDLFVGKRGARPRHVHVVIIGFAAFDRPDKRLYEYEDISAEPVVGIVQNINPYLVAGGDLWIDKRRKPLCDAQPMVYGSKPVDGGHLILDPRERQSLLAEFPEAKRFVRPFLGSVELINAIDRWCLWLADANPAEWRHVKGIHDRVERVRAFRAKEQEGQDRRTGGAAVRFWRVAAAEAPITSRCPKFRPKTAVTSQSAS